MVVLGLLAIFPPVLLAFWMLLNVVAEAGALHDRSRALRLVHMIVDVHLPVDLHRPVDMHRPHDVAMVPVDRDRRRRVVDMVHDVVTPRPPIYGPVVRPPPRSIHDVG